MNKKEQERKLEMNTRPILMSAPMVLANLARRKTQTRRMTGLQNIPEGYRFVGVAFPHRFCESTYKTLNSKYVDFEKGGRAVAIFNKNNDSVGIPCPYGTIGDRLWVRESICREIYRDWFYGAGAKFLPMDYPEGWLAKVDHKRSIPSIHMPRWASRILLEITNIRVERLQDISEDDAIDEGIDFEPDYDLWMDYERKQWFCVDPIDSYKSLINSINGAKAWDRNPWVWVVEYKIIEIKGIR